MDHSPVWERVADALSKIGGFLAAVAGLWGVARLLPKVFSHARLAVELSSALEAQRIAEEAARQYRQAAEAYRERIDGLVDELEGAVRRADSAADRSESAILYVVDLIQFMQSGRPFAEAPPIPEDLQQAVHDVLSRRLKAKREQEEAKTTNPFE